MEARETDGEGRWLTATRDIQKGEVILREEPLVTGPIYTRSRAVCLECLKNASEESYRCTICNFPVCDQKCQSGRWHKLECSLFESSGYRADIKSCVALSPFYSCITPLRLLALREAIPEVWAVADKFMDHDDARARTDSNLWKIHEVVVVNFIREILKLGDKFSERDIRKVIGILRTNSVLLDKQGGFGEGVALYPVYTLMNHSCVNNTRTFKHNDNRMELVAMININKGEQLLTRYVTPQLGSVQRVADLQNRWHFTCNCARCQDPTEFGTFMSAIKCKEDCEGYLISKRPLLVGAPWKCTSCTKTLGISQIQTVLTSVSEDIAKHRNHPTSQLLQIIENNSQILHPNHYLTIGIKELLVQRLINQLRIDQTSETGLRGKERLETLRLRTKLFSEIADVLEKVDSVGETWRSKVDKMEKELKMQEILLENQEGPAKGGNMEEDQNVHEIGQK